MVITEFISSVAAMVMPKVPFWIPDSIAMVRPWRKGSLTNLAIPKLKAKVATGELEPEQPTQYYLDALEKMR
jgi:hypothetical protein